MVPLAVKTCLRQVGEERSCGRGEGGASDGLSIHAVPLGAGPVSCGPVVLNAEVLLKGRGGGGSQQLGPVSHTCCFVKHHCVLGCRLSASIRRGRVKLSAQGSSREGSREGTGPDLVCSGAQSPAVYEWFPQPLL